MKKRKKCGKWTTCKWDSWQSDPFQTTYFLSNIESAMQWVQIGCISDKNLSIRTKLQLYSIGEWIKARLKINWKLMATQLKPLPSSGVNPEERSSIESAMKTDSWFPLRKRLLSSSSWFVVYELESSRDLGHILQKWSW